jgi:hypothetical protein
MLRPFRTDYRIWAFIAGCLFVVLGFVDPEAGATWTGHSFWTLLGVLLRGEYICSTADLVVSIVGRAVLLLAVPAVTLGWVLQAFVVMLWSMAQSKPLGISTDPRESFFLPEVRK